MTEPDWYYGYEHPDFKLCVRERRLGQFRLKRSWLYDYPKVCHNLLSNLLILTATWDGGADAVSYCAFGPDFKSVRAGDVAPLYGVSSLEARVSEGPHDIGKIEVVALAFSKDTLAAVCVRMDDAV